MDLLSFALSSLERLLARVPAPLRRAARFAVEDDRGFVCLVLAFNLFLARRTFGAGLWADNDSVGHLAYATYLRDEFYPQTGTFLGWCPKYNLGLPFLLFNVPPLLYVLTAGTSKLLGISVLAALKGWMVAAFLGVPLAGAELVRSFEKDARHLYKFALVTFSLFSSELFGLEFFFNNGMLNPAFAVPLMLATLAAHRRALTAPAARAPAWVALTAALFAATLLTHTLSAYMGAVALAAITLGDAYARWSVNLVKLGAALGLAAGLAAFWLLPSLVFGAKTDAAYTWIRNPESTLSSFFDGSIVSSYWGGFFPHFTRTSNVGIVAVAAAGIALFAALAKKSYAVLGVLGALFVALWITCGPAWGFGISIAPMYDRLLWYRFVTLVIAMTLAAASYGAWHASTRAFRFWPLNAIGIAICAAWAALVMTQRAVKVETTKDYPTFMESMDKVVDKLNARPHARDGGESGRVFSEFLGFNVVEAASVNYPREMLPVLTGLDEVGGWIYENNPASQVVLKRGPFWYNSIPILELAERYDVSYVVAGSPNLVKALASDPRWTRLVETPDLVLFQRNAPSRFAEARGWDVNVAERAYVKGGGYRFRFTASPARDFAGERARTLLVKTNATPGWTARAGGRELAVTPTDDGLIQIALPDAGDVSAPLDIELSWDITALRARANRVSLAALGAALLLALAGLSKRAAPLVARLAALAPLPAWLAPAALGAATLLLAWRARAHDMSHVGFGIADGMMPVYRPDEIRVGTFDDDAARPNRVLPAAWGAREAREGRALRALEHADAAAARVALSPSGKSALVIEGAPAGAALRVALVDPAGARVACEVSARVGTAVALPPACVAGADPARGPGVARDVRLAPDDAGARIFVSRIGVESDIAYLEAESFRNVIDDGGDDAFYSMGAVEQPPANGASITASARYDHPIVMRKDVTLPPGEYDAWALVRASHPRLRATRGNIELAWGGDAVGVIDGTSFAIANFWDSLIHFDWFRIGTLKSAGEERVLEMAFKKRKDAGAGVVDIDQIALVPRGR